MWEWLNSLNEWAKITICIVAAFLFMVIGILFLVIPMVWTIRYDNAAYLLLWCIPISIPVGITIYSDLF